MDVRKITVILFVFSACCLAFADVVNYAWCVGDTDDKLKACLQQKDKLTKTPNINCESCHNCLEHAFDVAGTANPNGLDLMIPVESNQDCPLDDILEHYGNKLYTGSKFVVVGGEIYKLRPSDPDPFLEPDDLERFAIVPATDSKEVKVFWTHSLSQDDGNLAFTSDNIKALTAAKAKTKLKNLAILIDAAIASNSDVNELVTVLKTFQYVILESRGNKVKYNIKGLAGLCTGLFGSTDLKVALNPDVFQQLVEEIKSLTTTTKDADREVSGDVSWKINLNLIILSIVFGFVLSQ